MPCELGELLDQVGLGTRDRLGLGAGLLLGGGGRVAGAARPRPRAPRPWRGRPRPGGRRRRRAWRRPRRRRTCCRARRSVCLHRGRACRGAIWIPSASTRAAKPWSSGSVLVAVDQRVGVRLATLLDVRAGDRPRRRWRSRPRCAPRRPPSGRRCRPRRPGGGDGRGAERSVGHGRSARTAATSLRSRVGVGLGGRDVLPARGCRRRAPRGRDGASGHAHEEGQAQRRRRDPADRRSTKGGRRRGLARWFPLAVSDGHG